MPPTSIVRRSGTRADGRAGQGGEVPSECKTPIKDDGTNLFFPPLKQLCVRSILNTDNAHVITGPDIDTLLLWVSQNGFNAVRVRDAITVLKYIGKSVGSLSVGDPFIPRDTPRTEPPKPGDPVGDTINGVAKIVGEILDPANWLAVLATALGAFLIFRGMRGVF